MEQLAPLLCLAVLLAIVAIAFAVQGKSGKQRVRRWTGGGKRQ